MSKTATNNPLTQEILTESIWKLMAKFSLPAIIAMSINSVNTFVDALFIGQYVGQDALAAVSLAFPNRHQPLTGIALPTLLGPWI